VGFLGNIEINSRPVSGLILGKVVVGLFHGPKTGLHVEYFLDVLIGKKDHFFSASFRLYKFNVNPAS
jgi:hypothetical protein